LELCLVVDLWNPSAVVAHEEALSFVELPQMLGEVHEGIPGPNFHEVEK
jgi:hypothetical protein